MSDQQQQGKAAIAHLERACELLWQSGHPAIAEALAQEVKAVVAERDGLHAVLYPPIALNREQRRAMRYGDALGSQFDHGPRQGG